MGVAHQPAAGGKGCRYARFGPVIGHPDVDVHPVALGTWCVHPLEVEGRPAAVRVDQVLRTVRSIGVAEQRTPEPHHIRPCEGIDGDLDGLNGGRVCRDSERACQRRDAPGQFDVALAQTVEVVGERDESHGHAVVPHIDVGVPGIDVGQFADRLHEPRADRQRPGAEIRTGSLTQDTPVLQAHGLVEPLRRDTLDLALDVCHAINLAAGTDNAPAHRARPGRASRRERQAADASAR